MPIRVFPDRMTACSLFWFPPARDRSFAGEGFRKLAQDSKQQDVQAGDPPAIASALRTLDAEQAGIAALAATLGNGMRQSLHRGG